MRLLATRLNAIASSVIKRYFTPLSLFSLGEQGAWYDPSDLSTLFQDSAGTVPVTAVEQPVGRLLDKSGRGNHAFQATTTSRPILKQDVNGKYYLLFDGIDDGMQTSTIDFTATDKMTVFAGVNAPSSAVSIFLELSVNATSNDGSFYISDNEVASGIATHRVKGTGTLGGGSTAATPDKLVGTWRFDTSASSSEQTNVRYNGTGVVDSIVGTTQPLNFGNYPLFIGRRAGVNLPFNGHFYGLITRGALSTDAQITSTEKWLANKTGVTL